MGAKVVWESDLSGSLRVGESFLYGVQRTVLVVSGEPGPSSLLFTQSRNMDAPDMKPSLITNTTD